MVGNIFTAIQKWSGAIMATMSVLAFGVVLWVFVLAPRMETASTTSPAKSAAPSSTSAPAVIPVTRMTTEELDAWFKCPNVLSTKNEISAVVDYMAWAKAKHPNWSIDEMLQFRAGLLAKHHCGIDGTDPVGEPKVVELKPGLYYRTDNSVNASTDQRREIHQRVCIVAADLSDYRHFVPFIVGGSEGASFCLVTNISRSRNNAVNFSSRCEGSPTEVREFSGEIMVRSQTSAHVRATSQLGPDSYISETSFQRIADCN